jgi:hypothetical protein
LPHFADKTTAVGLAVHAQPRLAARIFASFVSVRLQVHRRSLPELVGALARTRGHSRTHWPPRRLGNAVDRTLRLGRRRPTCLVSSLVLFRLLRQQGDAAELVIGLPLNATDKDAHAWVELAGMDVGPPPGRNGHVELARYP